MHFLLPPQISIKRWCRVDEKSYLLFRLSSSLIVKVLPVFAFPAEYLIMLAAIRYHVGLGSNICYLILSPCTNASTNFVYDTTQLSFSLLCLFIVPCLPLWFVQPWHTTVRQTLLYIIFLLSVARTRRCINIPFCIVSLNTFQIFWHELKNSPACKKRTLLNRLLSGTRLRFRCFSQLRTLT